MNTCDLTEFLNKQKTIIYSDSEGAGPTRYLGTEQYSDKNNYLILGDLFDSTGKESPDRNINIDTKKEKSNNIRNILNIICNHNHRLILGNRDINKLKCGYLTMLQHNEIIQEVKTFNEGNLNNNNIKDIFNKLKGNIQWICDMKNWHAYWGYSKFLPKKPKDDASQEDKTKYNTQVEQAKKQIKQWITENSSENSSNNTFKNRFDKIFGTDTTIGTMSADALLSYIPDELGFNINYILHEIYELNNDKIHEKIHEKIGEDSKTIFEQIEKDSTDYKTIFKYEGMYDIDAFIETIKLEKDNEKKKDYNKVMKPLIEMIQEFQAFVVLATFRAMFVPTHIIENQLTNTTYKQNLQLDELTKIQQYYESILKNLNYINEQSQQIHKETQIMPLNISDLRGALIHFYQSSHVKYVGYTLDIENKTLYLFSHGGITKQFASQMISEDKGFFDDEYQKKVIASIKAAMKDITLLIQPEQITGGGSGENMIRTIPCLLIRKLEIMNNVLVKKTDSEIRRICKLLDVKPEEYKDYKEPTDDMLFLLSVSAPFDTKPFRTFIKDKQEKKEEQVDYNTAFFGPINARIQSYSDEWFTLMQYNIVQFVGHTPAGFTSPILLNSMKNIDGKTDLYSMIVGLDTSTSYIYSNIYKKGSYLHVSYNRDDKFILNAKISVDGFNTLKDISQHDLKKNYIFTESDTQIKEMTLTANIQLKSITTDKFETKFEEINNKCKDFINKRNGITVYYHGEYTSENNNTYVLYTIDGGPTNGWAKSLIAIPVSEKQFGGFKYGGAVQDPFYLKYLKYKHKYLELKKQ